MSREDVEGAGSWAGLMTGSDCPEKVATSPRSPGRPGRGQSWKLFPLGAGSPPRSHSEQPRAGHSPRDGLSHSGITADMRTSRHRGPVLPKGGWAFCFGSQSLPGQPNIFALVPRRRPCCLGLCTCLFPGLSQSKRPPLEGNPPSVVQPGALHSLGAHHPESHHVGTQTRH